MNKLAPQATRVVINKVDGRAAPVGGEGRG